MLSRFLLRLRAPLRLVLFMALGYALTLFVPDGVIRWMAIRPRTTEGLSGVLLHPLLHFGWPHLWANTVGVLLFGGLVALESRERFLRVTALGWLPGGLLTWLISPSAAWVGGASGVVFAYLAYLMLQGFYRRRLLPALFSLAMIVLFYGSLIGLLPVEQGVSWQGHAAGFLAGALAASRLRS